MLKGPDKNNFLFDDEKPFWKENIHSNVQKSLVNNLNDIEEVCIPEKYIEKISIEDVKLFFDQAEKLFSQHHYAQAISKIKSILLLKGKWLSNILCVRAFFLEAKCLFELGAFSDVFTTLSYIETHHHALPLEDRLAYRFLMGKVYMQLKDYNKAHAFLWHIVDIKHNIWKIEFDKILNISDYIQVLLWDVDCIFMWTFPLKDEAQYLRVNSLLKEAKAILLQHPSFIERKKLANKYNTLVHTFNEYTRSKRT